MFFGSPNYTRARTDVCTYTHTQQSVCGWQYICSPTPGGFSSVAKEVMVATSLKQGSSKKLSSR